MKKYSTVLFDLDGTLEDPASGLVSSFAYALGKMNIDYGTREGLKRFIGPPLYSEWKRVFSLTDRQADRALRLFHEYYSVYGWWDCRVYDGVEELLCRLKRAGLMLAVATSKPDCFARKVLSHFGLLQYFDFVGAANNDRSRDKKHEVLDYVFSSVGEERREGAVLVGDRSYDAEGARLCGIDSVGVLWGHGTEEEIYNSGFTYTAKEPRDILGLLLG